MGAGLDGHSPGLPLTGERTVPDLAHEHYWFTRHLAAYSWALARCHGTVLDAGAGEGYGTALLAQAAKLAVALDIEQQVTAHAKQRYPGIQVVTGNLWSWPLGTERVDVVVSLQVLEHLWDTLAFLAEAQRCLRPAGLLIISTPNRLTFSPGLARGERPTNPFHVEEFDAEQLVGLLAASHFTDIALHGMIDGRGDALDQVLIGQPDPAAWSPSLCSRVASTAIDDFPVVPLTTSLDRSRANNEPRVLDLIVTAQTPSGAYR